MAGDRWEAAAAAEQARDLDTTIAYLGRRKGFVRGFCSDAPVKLRATATVPSLALLQPNSTNFLNYPKIDFKKCLDSV
jgi:hypothetical protein